MPRAEGSRSTGSHRLEEVPGRAVTSNIHAPNTHTQRCGGSGYRGSGCGGARRAPQPLGPPGWAGTPHTLLPPAAAEAQPGPTGQMNPAALGPNAAPRTRIPPPRRRPGPHLPLRHGKTRHGSAQRAPARSDPAQLARDSPARPLRPSRRLPLTDRRHPATAPPRLRTANQRPVSTHDPAPPPAAPNHRAVHFLVPSPVAAPAGRVSQKWAGLSAKQAPPRGFCGHCRAAHARSAARGGAGNGRPSPHDHPPCCLWLAGPGSRRVPRFLRAGGDRRVEITSESPRRYLGAAVACFPCQQPLQRLAHYVSIASGSSDFLLILFSFFFLV